VIHGALSERDANFTPVRIYRKRINLSSLNPFPNLPDALAAWRNGLWPVVDLASTLPTSQLRERKHDS